MTFAEAAASLRAHNRIGIKPLSAFCARQKGIMGLLLDILENSPEDAAILRRWVS
jgi:uncharacterized protein